MAHRGAQPKRKTTERGYGWTHRKKRQALPPPQGDPCPFPYCGHAPMWPDQYLDADHEIPIAQGGKDSPLRWSHRACNRRHGAVLGAYRRHRRTSRDW